MPSIAHMSLYISDENLKKIRDIKTKSFKAFEYEGILFKGDAFEAKIEFFFLNPEGGDFLKWLNENRKMISCPS